MERLKLCDAATLTIEVLPVWWNNTVTAVNDTATTESANS
jgi:hypothetical protein